MAVQVIDDDRYLSLIFQTLENGNELCFGEMMQEKTAMDDVKMLSPK